MSKLTTSHEDVKIVQQALISAVPVHHKLGSAWGQRVSDLLSELVAERDAARTCLIAFLQTYLAEAAENEASAARERDVPSTRPEPSSFPYKDQIP